MSRKFDAASARLRLVLVIAAGALIAQLLPMVLATSADSSSAVALMALGLALTTVMVLSHPGAAAVPFTLTLRAVASSVVPPILAGRATDPLHHPLRPRAPGLV